MNKKSTLLLTAALAVSLGLTAQPKEMDKAIETFLASDELLTKDTHWSHAMGQWHFKQTAEGDTLTEPAALARLKGAFASSVLQASSAYFHDAADGPQPFREMHISRKDNVYGGIFGRYVMEDGQNFRLLTFTENGQPAYYGLKWRVDAFNDRHGRPWRTLEGMLFRFTGGIWQLNSFVQNDWRQNYSRRPLSGDDQLKYETLLAQLKGLKMFTGQQADERLYITTKLIDNFDGLLTELQLKNVLAQIPPFTDSAERQRLLEKAVSKLNQYTRTLAHGHVSMTESNTVGHFTNPEDERIVNAVYDLGADHVQIRLTGQAQGEVTVRPLFPGMPSFEVLPDGGRFTLSELGLKDQLYEVTDRRGHRLVLFADSIPTTVNLSAMTVSGSDLNERFAATQRRLQALEPELRKYAIRDADGDYTVMDAEGYGRLLDDALRLQLQLIDENTDNLIPAWFLATNFTAMTYEELSLRLRHDRPYADHVALQPVWKYFEGLAKRQPGLPFADAACVDTAGVTRRLSDYIGHGDYVVLQFWEERDWTAHSGCKYMKQMAKAHRGKNLRLVGLSLDADKARWRRYVKKRDLCYDHLAVPEADASGRWKSEAVQAYGIMSLPETIVFDPDGRILKIGLAGESLTRYVSTLPLK